jgi:hypothetical protein
MKTTFILTAMLALSLFSSCKKETIPGVSGSCFADKITFTQTNVQIMAGMLMITFDAKNTSSKDYDVEKGDKIIDLKFVVTNTDGTKDVSTVPFFESKISAGTTISTITGTEIGDGKTYQSYTMTTSCE